MHRPSPDRRPGRARYWAACPRLPGRPTDSGPPRQTRVALGGSNFLRNYVPGAILAAQEAVGFVVARELLRPAIEVQHAARTVSDVGEMRQRGRKVQFFGTGVEVGRLSRAYG